MMPTMPPDSHIISLKIIEAIKQHPVLYVNDIRGISIKIQEFRQRVWRRISDELALDPTWVRLRWKNLRDTYCRILKYKNKTDKGIRRKKWIFEDHLSFLKFPYEPDYQPQCIELTEEYIRDINYGGIEPEGLLEQLEDKIDEDYSEYLEVLEETTADPVLEDSQLPEVRDNGQPEVSDRISMSDEMDSQQREIDSCVQQIQSKFRKIRPKRMKIDESTTVETPSSYSILKSQAFRPAHLRNINVDDSSPVSPIIITHSSVPPPVSMVFPHTDPTTTTTTMTTTRKDHGKNSTELFFNSMARTVKLLPLKAQVDIKMAVCKIVTEAEMRYSRSNASKNTQQFVAPPGMIPKLVLVPCSMIDNPGKRG